MKFLIPASCRPYLPIVLLGLLALPQPSAGAGDKASSGEPLHFRLRTRVETGPGSGRYHVLSRSEKWVPKRTAVIICDMWDKHWCTAASRRVAEMAPRMDDLVTELRKRGVLIIHCPSDTMDYYKDTPQRRRAQGAPRVKPPVPLQRWCKIDTDKEGKLPIDDSDGGCDSPRPEKTSRAWSRQIAALHIEEPDAITDSDEAYHLLRQRGIDHVLIMGVHTNMCVLGRPFGIRQLVAQGLKVALVRDLTDTMYNPARPPYVSHFTGTDLVIAHIEKHWCPTITSADVLGGEPFRFKEDTRARLVCVLAEDEYRTEQTVPEFARRHLDASFQVSYVFASSRNRNDLPGLDVLDRADLALFSIRRRLLPRDQLETVRRFLAAGKPLVAIRTTSHAFAPLPGKEPAAGHEAWLTFDADILGCHYQGHHGLTKGNPVRPAAHTTNHPLLAGLPLDGWKSVGSLYKVKPLSPGAMVLLLGQAGSGQETEPVAWTWSRKDGGRVFSTTLGHPTDFEGEPFSRLLLHGIRWAAGQPASAPAAQSYP